MSESAINHEEYQWKNDPILSRFSFEFSKKIRTNPMYHTVYAMLCDPNIGEHQIIEALLKVNESLSEDIVSLKENQTPKFYVRKE